MEATISYNDRVIAALKAGQTAQLHIANTEVKHDLFVTVPVETDGFNDGNTHIWISLPEGRTSPMLGIGVNGTVTVDWGDGTEPDVLTGISTGTLIYSPVHDYGSAGDYVITLTVDGELGLPGTASMAALLRRNNTDTDKTNYAYLNAIQRIELGSDVTLIGYGAFNYCYSLTGVRLPDGITSIGGNTFAICLSLADIDIPYGVTNIGNAAFHNCSSLSGVKIPASVLMIGDYAFYKCYGLASVDVPANVTHIGGYAFAECSSLSSVSIGECVASIGNNAFANCCSLAKIRFERTAPPTADGSAVFNGVPTDCVISVPVGCLEAYTTATNYPDPNVYTYVEE